MALKDGCAEFQQMMLNYLGDRDYDSFDFHEFLLLEEKIGYALYGPPQTETGYDDKQKKKIKFLYDVIVKESNLISKWKDRVIVAVIYNCTQPLPEEKRARAKKYHDYKPEYDLMPVPVFVLRRCKNSKHPCRVFIDDAGRVYESWSQYLTKNKLPECDMVLPLDGRYQDNSNGEVLLERHPSPACGIDTKILKGTDIATAVGGLASGGVFVAAAIPAITVAPVALAAAAITGVGVGAYSIGRSIYTLVDRGKHKQSLSFADSESRGAYLTIVAGALGFVGAGANVAVSQLAARGVNIGAGGRAVFNAVNIANLSASGVSVANCGFDVIYQWISEDQAPSALTILQLTSSILFFGHAVYSFQFATTIIKNSQANTLQDMHSSLGSNKQKRIFNKLLKESIRQHDGNVIQGQAEVIKAIRSMGTDKDQVIATLSRWNKVFNKNDVRFAVKDGEITLNGVPVDVNEFTSMNSNKVVSYIKKLPGRPNPSQNDVRIVASIIDKAFYNSSGIGFDDIKKLAFGILTIFGNDLTITQKIINAVGNIISWLLRTSDTKHYMNVLDRMFPQQTKYFKLISMVSGYFQMLVDEVEKKYQKWCKTMKLTPNQAYFLKLSIDSAKRATEIFDIVSKAYFIGNNLTEYGLKELLNYFFKWFTAQVYQYEQDQERKKERIKRSEHLPAPKVKCDKCGGEFYDRASMCA